MPKMPMQTPQELFVHAEQQAKNIEQIVQMMGALPHSVQCHAVQGFQRELEEAKQANPTPMASAGAVLGGAIETEHDEIAGDTGPIEQARAVGTTEAAQLLRQNLRGEQMTLQKLGQISKQMARQMASIGSGQMGMGQSAGKSGMQGQPIPVPPTTRDGTPPRFSGAAFAFVHGTPWRRVSPSFGPR